MIAILCPTKGRKKLCERMLTSAFHTTEKKPGCFIGYSDALDYPGTFFIDATIPCKLPDLLPTAHKWNVLAEEAMKNPANKLFMLASDDIVFTTPCWDEALIDHYNALENKIHVYALRDSRDPDGTPHPIVTREYIEAMGYFMPPIFLHWFVDSWTVEIAKANNCFTHLKDYELQHIKPSDTGQGDETHNRIRQMGWRGRDKWVADKCISWRELQVQRLNCAINNKHPDLAITDEYQYK